MRWFYRLQSRVGLSGPEGTALLVLAGALAAGFTARHVVAHAAPPPAALYTAADAAFARADSAATISPPGAAVHLAAPEALAGDQFAATADSATVDSTAAAVAEAAVEASAERSRGRKPPPVPTNVNTASEAELQRLPRIGPAMAARIVTYRRENGPFRRVEDLEAVRGIGPKTLEKLAPWVRL